MLRLIPRILSVIFFLWVFWVLVEQPVKKQYIRILKANESWSFVK